jgi:hypothetical protein
MKDIAYLLQESERTKLDIYVCFLSLNGCLCWRAISPRGNRPVVSVSVLTWFIKYIYYLNLQIPKTEIIIKTTVLLPRS